MNALASNIVQQATGQVGKPAEQEKNAAAVSLGRLGGLKGESAGQYAHARAAEGDRHKAPREEMEEIA